MVGINPRIPVIYMVLSSLTHKAPVGARSSPKTLETGVSHEKMYKYYNFSFCWIYQIEVGKEVIKMWKTVV